MDTVKCEKSGTGSAGKVYTYPERIAVCTRKLKRIRAELKALLKYTENTIAILETGCPPAKSIRYKAEN